MNSLIWLAVVLLIIWVVVRFLLAVTSVALHIVWIIAVLVFLIWLFKKFAG